MSAALEWVLDQDKESTPKDPTIREKFKTSRFADYKEKVIDLLGRVAAGQPLAEFSVHLNGTTLLTESLLTARHYGVETTVLDSLRNLFPGENWPVLARYMISRSLIHGRRRAEEMREVAHTVSEAGLEPHMSAASAQRQDWAAAFREAASIEALEPMLDAVLEKKSC